MIAFSNINNVIFGCEGLSLSKAEVDFFTEVSPVGFIFFKRNISTPDQFKALVAQCQDIVSGRPSLMLIDQEGGRVQRLQSPHWRHYPPMGLFGQAYDLLPGDREMVTKALSLNTRMLAVDLRAMGLNVNCLPLLDVPISGADNIIGDRAFSQQIETVTALGKIVTSALKSEGVLPVIKHIPGHGRGGVDSHKALPTVDTPLDVLKASDFKTFQPFADETLAMTAHMTFTAIDGDEPVTFSAPMVEDIIRSHIGFSGLLMSDDLSMGALAGSFAERAKKTIAAGVDLILHCNGKWDEMQAVTQAQVPLNNAQLAKLSAGVAALPQAFSDRQALEDEYDALVTELSAKLKDKSSS